MKAVGVAEDRPVYRQYPFPYDEPCRPGEMYLYVLEVVGHCVKVGITKNHVSRIATHRATAASFGRELGRRWVSGPHINARHNESRLKGNSPTEWLMGADFDEVERLAWMQRRLRAPLKVSSGKESGHG